MFKSTALLLSLGAAATFSTMTAAPALAQTPAAQPVAQPASCPAVLKHTFNRLQDEAPQDLCQYSGKVVLVVNTASYCGFTKQYEGLEKLYAKYAPRGLVVLGFPSNDFKQEDADAKKIADLCYNTYGVKFPMFTSTVVSGDKANALYSELIKATGNQPKWNFNKYLIDRNGKVIDYFPSKVTPEDPTLVGKIEQALKG
ncbi:glutathione peroxidase [Massilia sp. CT11-108]|uniref:glutathione peroxidase n=1 Tax=Massilia sp. CT11-108 TaxID=3393900 RepID=UPI0039A72049